MDLQRTTEIIIGIAQEAGAGALESYGCMEATIKSDGTIVTEADPAAEALVRERLRQHFPDHAVYGEEMGFEGAEDNPWRWYLDPIDGTNNYYFGLPLWGVSIGLTYEQRCVAGVFDMPALREAYWGWEGGGAYRNGRRLAPRDVSEMLPNDLVCISSTVLQRYEFSFPQKIRGLGSAAQALAGLAAGQFVGVIHDNWRLHDLAAGLVMCQETGMVITRDDGTPFNDFEGCDPGEHAPTLILAPPGLHDKLRACVHNR